MSRRRRTSAAGLLALVAAVLLATGCDDDENGLGEEGGPATFLQVARSGSFLGTGGATELVLRGVGGASVIAAEGTGSAGASGAISTAKLFRAGPELLGSEPWRGILAGAEVGPLHYSLLLSRPRYDPVLGAIRYRARVESGAPERPPASFGAVTLTLASALESGTIGGRVSSAEGDEPVAGALISVDSAGPALLTARSTADGTFEVGPLPAGRYEVEASAPGYERDAIEVTVPDGSAAELSLEPQAEQAQSG